MKPKPETWFCKNESQNFLNPKPENRFSKSDPENKIQTFVKPKNKIAIFGIRFSNKTQPETEISTQFSETKNKKHIFENQNPKSILFSKTDRRFPKFQNRFEIPKSVLKMMMNKNIPEMNNAKHDFENNRKTKPEMNDSKNWKIELNIYGNRKPKPNPEIWNNKLASTFRIDFKFQNSQNFTNQNIKNVFLKTPKLKNGDFENSETISKILTYKIVWNQQPKPKYNIFADQKQKIFFSKSDFPKTKSENEKQTFLKSKTNFRNPNPKTKYKCFWNRK